MKTTTMKTMTTTTNKGAISTAKEGPPQSTKDGGQISTKDATTSKEIGGSKVAGSTVQAASTTGGGGGGIDGSTAGDGGSQKKKAIVNLGTYEEMDATSSKKQKKKAVNRDAYEIIGGGDADDGYVLVPKNEGTDDITDDISVDDTPSGPSDRSMRRRQRHLRRLQEEEELMGRTRMVIVGCTALIGMILVIALLTAGGVILAKHLGKTSPAPMTTTTKGPRRTKGPSKSTMSTTKPPKPTKPRNRKPVYNGNATYGYKECEAKINTMYQNSKHVNASYCSNVSPHLKGRSVIKPCSKFQCDVYEIWPFGKQLDDMTIGHDTLTPKRLLNFTMVRNPHEVSTTDAFFCNSPEISRNEIVEEQKRALLCVNGTCGDYAFGSPNETYDWSTEKGKWVDSCDRFACLFDEYGGQAEVKDFSEDVRRIVDDMPTFRRENCANADESKCTGSMNAVVYLQRMMCELNPDHVGDFCEFGVPKPGRSTDDPPAYRLFKCHDCANNQIPTVQNVFNDVRNQACQKYANESGPLNDGEIYNWTMVNLESTCTIICLDNNQYGEKKKRRVFLPDGTFCGDVDKAVDRNEVSYCVHGACIYWDPALTKDKIEPMGDCVTKLDERATKNRRFPKESKEP